MSEKSIEQIRAEEMLRLARADAHLLGRRLHRFAWNHGARNGRDISSNAYVAQELFHFAHKSPHPISGLLPPPSFDDPEIAFHFGRLPSNLPPAWICHFAQHDAPWDVARRRTFVVSRVSLPDAAEASGDEREWGFGFLVREASRGEQPMHPQLVPIPHPSFGPRPAPSGLLWWSDAILLERWPVHPVTAEWLACTGHESPAEPSGSFFPLEIRHRALLLLIEELERRVRPALRTTHEHDEGTYE